jgi:hypothetical protein
VTGLAAAEFALMAGAQRVEGRLLGRGERAGDICLTTLAAKLSIDLSPSARARVPSRALRLLPHWLAASWPPASGQVIAEHGLAGEGNGRDRGRFLAGRSGMYCFG